jgi:hypothetical protein
MIVVSDGNKRERMRDVRGFRKREELLKTHLLEDPSVA